MAEKTATKASPAKKMTVPERVFAATALALSLLAVGLTVGVLAAPKAEAQPESKLYIDSIFPVLDEKGSDNRTARLAFEIWMTNNGDGSADGVKLTAYGRRSTGLVDARGEADFGRIEPKKTVIRTVQLGLPQGRLYSVELVVLESELLVLSGQGTVDLRDTTPPNSGGQSGGGASFDKDKVNQPPAGAGDRTYPETACGYAGASAMGLALFGILFLFLLLGIAWAVFRYASKRPASAPPPPVASGFYRP
jgi:hypothetical protein